MRKSIVLSFIFVRICTGFDKNGKRTEFVIKSQQNIRCMWQTYVLSENEEETYEYLNSRLPQMGDKVTTVDGFTGEVTNINVLRQLVKVKISLENDEKDIKEYKVSEIKFKPKRRRNNINDELSDKEIRELEELERREGKSKLDDN